MGTAVQGNQEDFEKALDKVNPDPTTHYNKESSEEETEIEELTLEEQSIQTLITACEIACQKGAFTLDEARIVMNAIDSLNTPK